jgi:tetratricopeptide (TPR) repeat protein
MVDVSLLNGDTQTALKASQTTLRLATNSIHENPDDYVKHVDVASEAAGDIGNSADKKRLLNEAAAALSQLGKRFSDDPSVKVRKALAESRFHASQGNKLDSEKALKAARSAMQESPGALSMETQIELGKTLFVSGKEDEAERLFSTLVGDQHVDPQLKQKINDFMDEPVSPTAKAKAKECNSVALAAYAKKDFPAAIAAFKEALEHSPRHPGLNLNLVQTCLKLMGKEGEQRYLINECLEAMRRVRHINPSHRQYTRYENLKDFLKTNYNIVI